MLGPLGWLHYFLIGGKVPQDRTIVRQVLRTVSLPLFICMWTVSCIGIMAAIALIVFNIWYRHRRYVFLKIIILHEIIKVHLKDADFLLFAVFMKFL
jgi:hypothetical protein